MMNSPNHVVCGKRPCFIYRFLCAFVALAFTSNLVVPPSYAQTILNLPQPGTQLVLTPTFAPVMMRGINLYPDNPFKFDFILDRGETNLDDKAFSDESNKLIKYFMAALTVPEKEMWVNLNPTEKDRVVGEHFGKTEMGRDLLAQDYLLKQLTASLMNPDGKIGGEFWKRVNERAQKEFAAKDLNTDVLGRVWIVPEKATVYEYAKGAFVVNSHLKVLMEDDYKNLLQKNGNVVDSGSNADLIRQIIIPELEREVNEGKTFAPLRQVYNAFILATWFKNNLKSTLLGQVYVDQNKTASIENADKNINQKIYSQYLEAFKKGAFEYVKEDFDAQTQSVVAHKYFSGGVKLGVTVNANRDQGEVERSVALMHNPTTVTASVNGDVEDLKLSEDRARPTGEVSTDSQRESDRAMTGDNNDIKGMSLRELNAANNDIEETIKILRYSAAPGFPNSLANTPDRELSTRLAAIKSELDRRNRGDRAIGAGLGIDPKTPIGSAIKFLEDKEFPFVQDRKFDVTGNTYVIKQGETFVRFNVKTKAWHINSPVQGEVSWNPKTKEFRVGIEGQRENYLDVIVVDTDPVQSISFIDREDGRFDMRIVLSTEIYAKLNARKQYGFHDAKDYMYDAQYLSWLNLDILPNQPVKLNKNSFAVAWGYESQVAQMKKESPRIYSFFQEKGYINEDGYPTSKFIGFTTENEDEEAISLFEGFERKSSQEIYYYQKRGIAEILFRVGGAPKKPSDSAGVNTPSSDSKIPKLNFEELNFTKTGDGFLLYGDLYSSASNRILRLKYLRRERDNNGKVIHALSVFDSGNGQFLKDIVVKTTNDPIGLNEIAPFFAPDGRTFIVVTDADKLTEYNLEGNIVAEYPTEGRRIENRGYIFSPDGKFLVMTNSTYVGTYVDSTIIWDRKGNVIKSLKFGGQSIIARDSGFFIFSHGKEKSRKIGWNGDVLKEFKMDYWVGDHSVLDVSKDETFVVASNEGRNILNIFTVGDSNGPVGKSEDLLGKGEHSDSFRILKNGNILLITDADKDRVKIFNRSGELIHSFNLLDGVYDSSYYFLFDDQVFVKLNYEEGGLDFFQLEDGKKIGFLKFPDTLEMNKITDETFSFIKTEKGLKVEVVGHGTYIVPIEEEVQATSDRATARDKVDPSKITDAMVVAALSLYPNIASNKNAVQEIGDYLRSTLNGTARQPLKTEVANNLFGNYGFFTTSDSAETFLNELEGSISNRVVEGDRSLATGITPDVSKKVGGIDFNPANMKMDTQKNGNGVIMPSFKGPIPAFDPNQFKPVIIKIAPTINLPQLLGLKVPDAKRQELSYSVP